MPNPAAFPAQQNSANVCITSATTNGNLLLVCCLPLRMPMLSRDGKDSWCLFFVPGRAHVRAGGQLGSQKNRSSVFFRLRRLRAVCYYISKELTLDNLDSDSWHEAPGTLTLPFPYSSPDPTLPTLAAACAGACRTLSSCALCARSHSGCLPHVSF